ncbi:MAG: peptidoglycan-binding protein [Myxococcaceae bacterium]
MLTLGTRGSDVTRLQQTLQRAGFNPGGVDGVFGAKTKAAVMAYQRAHHLTRDGVVGAQTSRQLFGSTASKYYDGKSDFTAPVSSPGSGHGTASPRVEQAIAWALKIAADPRHGYSQARRASGRDYDCSSFVASAFKSAGFHIAGLPATANMRNAYRAAGFQVIPFSQVGKGGLRRGDILLRPSNLHGGHGHTALVTSSQSKSIVHAFGDHDGRPGESRGQEISTASYYNGNWDFVIRWPGT